MNDLKTTCNAFSFINPTEKEIIRIDSDGRIYWKGREVETDDDFRSAMMELRDAFVGAAK